MDDGLLFIRHNRIRCFENSNPILGSIGAFVDHANKGDPIFPFLVNTLEQRLGVYATGTTILDEKDKNRTFLESPDKVDFLSILSLGIMEG